MEDRKKDKDHILNIRVSKETYEKIKGMAHENSETVSNLVRKVIRDSAEIFDDVFNVNHWSDIKTYSTEKAACDIVCEKSGKKIKKGGTVIVGETSSGRRHYFAPGQEP